VPLDRDLIVLPLYVRTHLCRFFAPCPFIATLIGLAVMLNGSMAILALVLLNPLILTYIVALLAALVARKPWFAFDNLATPADAQADLTRSIAAQPKIRLSASSSHTESRGKSSVTVVSHVEEVEVPVASCVDESGHHVLPNLPMRFLVRRQIVWANEESQAIYERAVRSLIERNAHRDTNITFSYVMDLPDYRKHYLIEPAGDYWWVTNAVTYFFCGMSLLIWPWMLLFDTRYHAAFFTIQKKVGIAITPFNTNATPMPTHTVVPFSELTGGGTGMNTNTSTSAISLNVMPQQLYQPPPSYAMAIASGDASLSVLTPVPSAPPAASAASFSSIPGAVSVILLDREQLMPDPRSNISSTPVATSTVVAPAVIRMPPPPSVGTLQA